MSSSYTVLDNSKPHYCTLTVVAWINLFKRDDMRGVLLDSLRYAQAKKGLLIHAYVIMPSHTHLIISARSGYFLWEILRDLKKFTAKEIIKCLKEDKEDGDETILRTFSEECEHLKNWKNYRVWQEGYHGSAVFDQNMFYQKLDYIHNNPAKAGLVRSSTDFEFSSARNYIGKSSPIEVTSI